VYYRDTGMPAPRQTDRIYPEFIWNHLPAGVAGLAIAAILAAVGLDFSCLLKTTVFLKDMAHFKTLNGIYASHVPEPYPARSALAVKELPLGAEVEIEAIAMIKK